MLRAAILHECQNYLGGGRGLGGSEKNIFLRVRWSDKSSVQSLFLGRGYCDIGYIGMCHCEGYGFQAVFSGIGYINQRVWV